MSLFKAFALAVVLAVGAAACGDSSDDASTTTETPTSLAPAQDSTADEMADDMADEMSDDEMADDMADEMTATTFTIHIENVSEGADVPTPFAPVVAYAGHGPNPIFAVGETRKAAGLEALAEDGDPALLAETIGGVVGAVPDSGTEPGPALPGDGYRLSIEGHEGDSLSLAFMFVQSNDWIFAIDALSLYEDGMPMDGDITDYVMIYDAGTEADQPIGEGADQAPRQAGPNTGDSDPDETVRLVGPATGLVQVTIHAGDMMEDMSEEG
ncbi:MAG: spondin domain-containing protein [Acidimicrobiales bacterium]